MDNRVLLRQLLRTPPASRTLQTPAMRPQTRNLALLVPTFPHARYLSLPRVIQPSFWASMIPSFLRNRPSSGPAREANPATPYIILGLLVGSQAIQVLWLKRDRAHDMRRAEAKIGLLREVIGRVQNGEDVDVEKELGTGVESEEKEWEEIMREIREKEILVQSRKKRKAARQVLNDEDVKGEAEKKTKEEEKVPANDAVVKVETYKGAKFY